MGINMEDKIYCLAFDDERHLYLSVNFLSGEVIAANSNKECLKRETEKLGYTKTDLTPIIPNEYKASVAKKNEELELAQKEPDWGNDSSKYIVKLIQNNTPKEPGDYFVCDGGWFCTEVYWDFGELWYSDEHSCPKRLAGTDFSWSDKLEILIEE